MKIKRLAYCVCALGLFINDALAQQAELTIRCVEKKYEDSMAHKLISTLGHITPDIRLMLDQEKESNRNPNRPMLYLRYASGKLNLINSEMVFLKNDIPNTPNQLGWVGDIAMDDTKVILKLTNARKGRLSSEIIFDRFTGRYEIRSYEDENMLYSVSSGFCEKLEGRVF